METKIIVGFAASLLVAWTAYKKRSLSVSGAAAAVLLGTLMYALGDIRWYGLLLAFFISSSLLSHRKKEEKQAVEDLFAKTGTRDWLQVAANGGLGLVAVVGAFVTSYDEIWYTFYIGMMAAVTSDTWATEIGVLARSKPRYIFTGRRVEPGTSGGISTLGLLASFAGGVFIGGLGALFAWFSGEAMTFSYIVAGALGGTVGSLADSALGAGWQQMYRCRVCAKETEKTMHCGASAIVVKGYAWCTNDVVNMTASLVGGAVATLVWWWI
ncbi:DUF92 domain-containing protein [Aneurinibacillus sp. REN35]|uniref:DUF92 domain-containing protein n=1 Tax=Aneurinibacillus sp. REN35 TaxID=3237286 RepID=UPI00352734CA